MIPKSTHIWNWIKVSNFFYTKLDPKCLTNNESTIVKKWNPCEILASKKFNHFWSGNCWTILSMATASISENSIHLYFLDCRDKWKCPERPVITLPNSIFSFKLFIFTCSAPDCWWMIFDCTPCGSQIVRHSALSNMPTYRNYFLKTSYF